MANFLDELRNRMAASPHVGPTPVTNPKLPTKVERDVAEFKVRQKAMPKFNFGTGSVLQQIKEHTAKNPHVGPTYADPAFKNKPLNMAKYDAEVEAFMTLLRANKEKRKLQKAEKEAKKATE